MDWLLTERITSSILNLVIAGIGIWIAIRQYQISKKNHKIELFNEGDQIYTLLEAAVTEMLYKKYPKYTVYSDYHKIEREIIVKLPIIKNNYYDIGKLVTNLAWLNYEIEMINESIKVAMDSDDEKTEFIHDRKNLMREKSKILKEMQEKFNSLRSEYQKSIDG